MNVEETVVDASLKLLDYGVLGIVLVISLFATAYLLKQHREERKELVEALKTQEENHHNIMTTHNGQLVSLIHNTNEALNGLENVMIKIETKLG